MIRLYLRRRALHRRELFVLECIACDMHIATMRGAR